MTTEHDFGGAGLQVTWGDGAQDWSTRPSGYTMATGCMSKVVHTCDFLIWNPEIAGVA